MAATVLDVTMEKAVEMAIEKEANSGGKDGEVDDGDRDRYVNKEVCGGGDGDGEGGEHGCSLRIE